MPAGDTIGIVLSGGGARGAYEAGALSVLLPALDDAGERPSLLVGTSVGAINAAYLAASAHRDTAAQVEGLLDRWRAVSKEQVVRPILLAQVPLTVLRYAGEVLSVPGVRLPSLLDPGPLERNLRHWIDWRALHDNVRRDRVETIAVVATAARTGRTVAFVEGGPDHRLHHSHVIEYVRAQLGDQHVRASAAIPILFPPVRVDAPDDARGWYVDGGTRMNTPIKPAIDLGAARLLVIGTESTSEPPTEPGRHECEPPDFGDGALHILQGALVDTLIEDMRMLGNVNAFFADPGEAPGAVRYRRARGKRPYRQIPYIFVSPPRHGAIGRLAREVFHERYRGLRGLRSPDFPLLNRLLGGESPTHGELLSYLFFDPEFIRALIAMGADDARNWLRGREAAVWQVEPLQAFVAERG